MKDRPLLVSHHLWRYSHKIISHCFVYFLGSLNYLSAILLDKLHSFTTLDCSVQLILLHNFQWCLLEVNFYTYLLIVIAKVKPLRVFMMIFLCSFYIFIFCLSPSLFPLKRPELPHFYSLTALSTVLYMHIILAYI